MHLGRFDYLIGKNHPKTVEKNNLRNLPNFLLHLVSFDQHTVVAPACRFPQEADFACLTMMNADALINLFDAPAAKVCISNLTPQLAAFKLLKIEIYSWVLKLY